MLRSRNLPYVLNEGTNNGNNNKLKEVVWKWAIKKFLRKTWKMVIWIENLRTKSETQKQKNICIPLLMLSICVCNDKDKVLSGRTMAGLLNLCIFYFQMSHLQTSNKQYMTPTFSVDVSLAFYSKNKFSQKHCQILWSRLKLTESCKYIFKGKET